MIKLGNLSMTAAALLAVNGSALAVTVGQVDTFEDGTTQGWTAGLGGFGTPPTPPHVESASGNSFLVVTSNGGSGAGSKLVTLNAQHWGGNYTAAGVTQIEMDLNNLGSSDLMIRLLMEDPAGAPPANEAVTTQGITLPVGGGWTHVAFPIQAGDLTALEGNPTTLLTNTTVLRILHAPTAGDAVAVVGQLGVDNILAVPEPAAGLLLAAGTLLLPWRSRRRA